MKNAILNNPYVKNILSALAVSFFGFILWNLAFVLYALFVKTVLIFTPVEVVHPSSWYMLLIFAVMLAILSWFVLKSTLPDLIKATWTTVPLVVVLVGIGILTYPNSLLSFGLSAAVVMLILLYLWLSKTSWIYFYATLFTTITLLIFTLSGGEI